MKASEKPISANLNVSELEIRHAASESQPTSAALPPQEEISSKRDWFISTPKFIPIFSFLLGFFDIIKVALFYYQKDVMGLSPFQMQMVMALFSTPEIFKPLLAYSMDRWLFDAIGRKNMIILSAFMKIGLVIPLMLIKVEFYQLIIMVLLKRICMIVDTIICEYSLVMVSKSKPEEKRNDAKEVSKFFTFRIMGNISGILLGGFLLNQLTMYANFFAGICITLMSVFLTLFYKENFTATKKPEVSCFEEFRSMRVRVSQSGIMTFLVLILILSCVPNIKSTIEFFMTEVVKFTPFELSMCEIMILIGEMAAIYLYISCLKNLNIKIFYVLVNGVALATGLSFLSVVFGYTSDWGITNKIFCVAVAVFSKFCLQLNVWPAMDAWYRLCSKEAGATCISFFTGLVVIAHNAGYFLGAFLVYFFGVKASDLGNIWMPIFVQNQFILFVLVAIVTMVKGEKSDDNDELTEVIPVDLD